MNKALWTWQPLWGAFFSVTGFGTILCYKPEVWNRTLPQLAWFSAVPQYLFVFIGICEFFGGGGLILSALTGVKPKLTSLAAFGLALAMIPADIFPAGRAEYNFLPINVGLGEAAITAYGPLLVKSIAPASIDPFRVLPGPAVSASLVLVCLRPVWYGATHLH